MGKVKTRVKLGYPDEVLTFQDGGKLPTDSENLDLTWGIPNWEIPPQKKLPLTPTKLMQCKKPIHSMHGRLQCMAISGTSAPSQILCSSSLDA